MSDAETMWQELLEKDDRTSPAEYPDMALITFDEFREALAAASKAANSEFLSALRSIAFMRPAGATPKLVSGELIERIEKTALAALSKGA